MNSKYVVSHLEVQMGPFDETEIKDKWLKGDLLPIDYIYDEGKQDWILLAEKFAWAKAVPETIAPPPLTEVTLKKKTPPEPPHASVVAAPVSAITEPHAVKDLKRIVLQGAKVKLVDGEGEVDLNSLQPGDIELVLQDTSAGVLKLQNSLKIHVKPAEPQALEWTLPVSQTCGQEAEIQVQALDNSGQLCAHYEDHFLIRVNGSEDQQIPVVLKEGQAIVKLNHTKTETWKLTFHYAGTKALKLPADKTLEWQPGPATKLILDGPQEYVAGHPLKVHVKAVDNFGNLAKTFQGTITLEVKAS